MNFEEMAGTMPKEFNSNSSQLQAQVALEALRLYKFMAENNINTLPEGLTKMVDITVCLTPQCHPKFRSEANKISCLCNAVIG